MKSQEQIAWAQFEKLHDVRDKMDVLDWMELGNSCQDAMINSRVLTGPRPTTGRLTPSEAAREREYQRQFGKLVERRIKNLLPNEVSRRYETAHHEASHAIIVMAFGKALRSVSIDGDDARSGLCTFEKGSTPLEIATICVAPIVWIQQVYYRQFRYYLPNGASGCESDLRRAQELVGYDMTFQLGRAFTQAREILTEHADEVIAVANRLDRDGEYRP